MTSLLRLGAFTGAVSGLLIAIASAVEIATGEIVSTSFALGIAPALALPLCVALHVGQHRAAGRLGRIGFGLNLVGLGLFGGAGFTLNLVLVHVDPAVIEALPRTVTLMLLGSAIVFSAGTVLFGIAMLRARVHPRLPAAVYTTALPLIALLSPFPDNLFISAVHILSGAGLVWLALDLRVLARKPALPGRAVALD